MHVLYEFSEIENSITHCILHRGKSMDLTIAIPSYNRVQLLLQNVALILKNSKFIKVMVVDNNSAGLNENIFKDYLKDVYNPDRVKYYRNKINIGGNSNITRCIELCDTEYIMILGDDDFLAIDFESNFYNDLKEKYDWVLYYQNDEFQPIRKRSVKCDSLYDFLSSLKSINELIFCSINIYKTKILKSGLQSANHYQHTMAPHLIAMIKGIESGDVIANNFFISNKMVLESVSNNKDESLSWPLYNAFIGIYSLIRVDFSNDTLKCLKKLIYGSTKQWLTNKALVYSMSVLSKKYGVRRAFNISSSVIYDSVSVNLLKSFEFVFLYIFSILFGKYILMVHAKLKRLYVKYSG